MKFNKRNLLITFHPVTLEKESAHLQMQQLLFALADLQDTELIFTMPNADTDGRPLIEMIRQFAATIPSAHAFTSLGQMRYLSCLAQVDGVVGNSSSGLIEVPSFRKGTINIGDRQRGRLQASSVINCSPKKKEIAKAIDMLYSAEFQAGLSSIVNPYGEGGASEKVVRVLRTHTLEGLIKKDFHDQSYLS